MNKKTLVDRVAAFLRRAALPLAVAVLLILIPPVRTWLLERFQTAPLWSALVIAFFAFLAAYLIRGRNGMPPVGALGSATAEQDRDAGLILALVLTVLGVGFLFTGASTALAEGARAASALRSSLLWAGAWFMAGFLGGFLFGIPKVAPDGMAPAPAGGAIPPGGYAQRPNTNLEQISDWLTKIIVGLGLVELKEVPDHVERVSLWVAQSLSEGTAPSAAAVSFAGSIVLYFTILGFLAGYLLTLLFIAGALGRAGQQAYGNGKGPSFGEDDLSNKIRSFWQPGGRPSPENQRKLANWIQANLPPDTTITALISQDSLDAARKKAVAEIPIP